MADLCSLVDNIHAKSTRPIYEVIQNVKYRSYSTAIAKGEEPYLRLLVLPDTIVVDSNENVLSEKDVREICSVGKHAPNRKYNGGKGIGLKSIFKIARKVHIQSGPFSFALSHTLEEDEDGLGIITPFGENAENLVGGVSTRMTFTLLESVPFEEISAELLGIPETFIIFLGQLQELTIFIPHPTVETTVICYLKRDVEVRGLCTTFVTKRCENERSSSPSTSTSTQIYHTTVHLLDTYLNEVKNDDHGSDIDFATVRLAFPVDVNDEPVIHQHCIYGFPSSLRTELNFLVLLDCVDQFDREGVAHSLRDRIAWEGVAQAFVDAMILFCMHPSLKYTWMRYLPEDSSTTESWSPLWTLVREKLLQTPLLEPWNGNVLCKPLDVVKLSHAFIDEDGHPLNPDLDGAQAYLSPKYAESDYKILKRLGTTTTQWSTFINCLDADLHKADASKWRSMRNTTEWRTQICKLLLGAFAAKSQDMVPHQDRLRTLALIPLHDGTWVSSTSLINKYFPQTDGISVPLDLGLDLLHPVTMENVAWVDLLFTLGIRKCLPDTVIGLINKRYDATNFENFNLSNAVAHIKYLYWFLPKDTSELAPQIRLANQHGSLIRKDQYLYFPDGENDLSPSKLFEQDTELPGHPVNYLHGDYLTVVDMELIHNGRSFNKWLEEMAGVCRFPVLCIKGNDQLSTDFQYIINHRSNRLLGILKRGWAVYHPLLNDQVKRNLCWNGSVLLENGQKKWMLSGSSLPFPKLKQIAIELAIAEQHPFLAMSEALRDEEKTDWSFSKNFQVHIEEDLAFYLSALTTFVKVNPTLTSPAAGGRLNRIYRNIQSRRNENSFSILYAGEELSHLVPKLTRA